MYFVSKRKYNQAYNLAKQLSYMDISQLRQLTKCFNGKTIKQNGGYYNKRDLMYRLLVYKHKYNIRNFTPWSIIQRAGSDSDETPAQRARRRWRISFIKLKAAGILQSGKKQTNAIRLSGPTALSDTIKAALDEKGDATDMILIFDFDKTLTTGTDASAAIEREKVAGKEATIDQIVRGGQRTIDTLTRAKKAGAKLYVITARSITTDVIQQMKGIHHSIGDVFSESLIADVKSRKSAGHDGGMVPFKQQGHVYATSDKHIALQDILENNKGSHRVLFFDDAIVNVGLIYIMGQDKHPLFKKVKCYWWDLYEEDMMTTPPLISPPSLEPISKAFDQDFSYQYNGLLKLFGVTEAEIKERLEEYTTNAKLLAAKKEGNQALSSLVQPQISIPTSPEGKLDHFVNGMSSKNWQFMDQEHGDRISGVIRAKLNNNNDHIRYIARSDKDNNKLLCKCDPDDKKYCMCFIYDKDAPAQEPGELVAPTNSNINCDCDICRRDCKIQCEPGEVGEEQKDCQEDEVLTEECIKKHPVFKDAGKFGAWNVTGKSVAEKLTRFKLFNATLTESVSAQDWITDNKELYDKYDLQKKFDFYVKSLKPTIEEIEESELESFNTMVESKIDNIVRGSSKVKGLITMHNPNMKYEPPKYTNEEIFKKIYDHVLNSCNGEYDWRKASMSTEAINSKEKLFEKTRAKEVEITLTYDMIPTDDQRHFISIADAAKRIAYSVARNCSGDEDILELLRKRSNDINNGTPSDEVFKFHKRGNNDIVFSNGKSIKQILQVLGTEKYTEVYGKLNNMISNSKIMGELKKVKGKNFIDEPDLLDIEDLKPIITSNTDKIDEYVLFNFYNHYIRSAIAEVANSMAGEDGDAPIRVVSSDPVSFKLMIPIQIEDDKKKVIHYSHRWEKGELKVIDINLTEDESSLFNQNQEIKKIIDIPSIRASNIISNIYKSIKQKLEMSKDKSHAHYNDDDIELFNIQKLLRSKTYAELGMSLDIRRKGDTNAVAIKYDPSPDRHMHKSKKRSKKFEEQINNKVYGCDLGWQEYYSQSDVGQMAVIQAQNYISRTNPNVLRLAKQKYKENDEVGHWDTLEEDEKIQYVEQAYHDTWKAKRARECTKCDGEQKIYDPSGNFCKVCCHDGSDGAMFKDDLIS